MKKYYLLILSILISVLSFGQNIETKEPTNFDFSRIRLSPFFSYDINLSSELIRKGAITNTLNYDIFNYRVGVDVEYKFNSNFSISSGINFSDRSFSQYSSCPVCDPLDENLKIAIVFLEIPITGIYTYTINDFEFFGQLGIINQVDVNFDFFDENFPPDNLNRYNFSGKIGVGVSYPIINKHRLFIATDYTSSITSLFKNIDYKIKTIGIRMGIQFLL